MKKGLVASYIDGIMDSANGESYSTILRYFWPEFVTALALYSILYLLDARFIADLKSTTMYATLGVTNTLLHFIVKVAEGMSIGAVIMCGQYNGAKEYANVGRAFVEAFWMIVVTGITLSGFLYLAAPLIYTWYGVSDNMLALGVPFLRLRAVGVLFMFLYFAFVAFLRSIKNTRTPMFIFILGGITFVFFDYSLIFGRFGCMECGFIGSAMATVIQYSVMLAASMLVVLCNKEYRMYSIKLLEPFRNPKMLRRFLGLSWPVVLDKATMAVTYIWLGKMLAKMGESSMASFTVLKDMERIAFLPAIAFATIITLLASNDFGSGNIGGIKSNIKKVLFMSNIGVATFSLLLAIWPAAFISLFDQSGDFTVMAATIFPFLAPLILFDVFQIVLSGALRGAADVKTVMWTRLFVCGCIFAPASYFVSEMAMDSQIVKFILIYGMFYISNGVMSMIYVNRFRSNRWKESLN
jgi:MATE family multidrug resistance protein